jgi:hypothetical protein
MCSASGHLSLDGKSFYICRLPNSKLKCSSRHANALYF